MAADDELLADLFLAGEAGAVLRAAAAVVGRSSGEVRKLDGINRRTGKPERDGLHCSRIFGPVADLLCLCGKLAGEGSAGRVCDRCGVLCGERRLRSERWGHIVSPVPLVHPRVVPAIAAALGCSRGDVLAVLRYEAELRDAGEAGEAGKVLRSDGGERAMGGGAWRIAEVLAARANALMITRVPVTPPGWRETRRDPQDAVYGQFVNRCRRLERLLELNAPQIIIDNEAYMTQQAFERLCEVVGRELKARGPVVVAPEGPRSEGLLAAIYDDPEDDGARRAYAAYLRAAGDPRGEFIDLQLARKGRARAAELLRRNYDRWVAPLGDVITEVSFVRGFVAGCKVAEDHPEPRIGDPAWATVEALDSDLLALVRDPGLRGLRGLALGVKTLVGLVEGGTVLPRVDRLQLRLPRCPPARAELVTECEALPGLRALTLVHTSARGLQAWDWLDGTPLARQLEGLRLVVALARVEDFALAWCVEFMRRHVQLERLDVEFGRRVLVIELRREGEWIAIRGAVSRGLVETIAIGDGALAGTLAGLLTALDPYGISSLRMVSPCKWFGDDLAGLAGVLQKHFGAAVTTPALA